MSSNRILKSKLLRKLSELKQSCNYPVKPNTNPAILYVESVLKPENLSWAPAHRRGTNLNQTVQRALRAWPQMDSSVKAIFERDAEELQKKFLTAENEWHKTHGDSDSAKEIRNIQDQLREL